MQVLQFLSALADLDQAFGGWQLNRGDAKMSSLFHLFEHPRFSVTIVEYNTKLVTFLGLEKVFL